MTQPFRLAWREELSDAEVVALVRSHEGRVAVGWWDRVRPFSLGWVTARDTDGTLVGFVNVAWDGGDHAFLLDPTTRASHQRRGIGTAVVRRAARKARAAGCEWLHVDFTDDLAPFYMGPAAFDQLLPESFTFRRWADDPTLCGYVCRGCARTVPCPCHSLFPNSSVSERWRIVQTDDGGCRSCPRWCPRSPNDGASSSGGHFKVTPRRS